MKKKHNFWFLLFFPICIYLGYTVGLMASENASPDCFLHYLSHPFPIVFDETVKTFMIIGLLCAVLMLLYYYSRRSRRPMMEGVEYGSAQWGDPKEFTQKYGQKPAKALSANVRMSVDDRATGRNNNVLIVGGSGSRKTFGYIKPFILSCLGSMLIVDPSGDILRETGKFLRSKGYKIRVLNLIDMTRSDGYNPLAYIRTDEDLTQIVDIILNATKPKDAVSSDPFWQNAEALLLRALVGYVITANEFKGRRNLKSVIELLRIAKIPESDTEKTALDKKFEVLEAGEYVYKDPTSGQILQLPGKENPCCIAYRQYRAGSIETIQSVLISLSASLGKYSGSPLLLKLMERDEMDFPSLGMGYRGGDLRRTAIFCQISDHSTTYAAVSSMFITQCMNELFFQADNNTLDGRLLIPTFFLLDEFSNTSLSKDFVTQLSVVRRRNMSCTIILQDIAQIKAKYKDEWQTIPANCDAVEYLGGFSTETAKWLSEWLGKATIGKQSTSNSTSTHGSSSVTNDIVGRELMSPDEILRLEPDQCLVIVRGERPIKDTKYDTLSDKHWIAAQNLGPYKYEDYHVFIPMAVTQPPAISPLSENESKSEASESDQKLIRIDLEGLKQIEEVPIEYQIVLSESDIKAYVASNLDSFKPDDPFGEFHPIFVDPDNEPTPEEKIRQLIASEKFNDDQISEAVFAFSDGKLSPKDILEWFRPDIPAAEMERRRKQQTSVRKQEPKAPHNR